MRRLQCFKKSSRASGFTLIELMVSVAIALLLVLGVNTIFSVTAQTVGAGESVLASARDARTVLQTMLSDVIYLDPWSSSPTPGVDAPCFLIRSEHTCAFRNANDLAAATNPTTPYLDKNLFSNFPSNKAPVPLVHFRSHRIDRLGFFARGLFVRQTSSNGVNYVAPDPSSNSRIDSGGQAWVIYGHSQQPNKTVIATVNDTDWRDPGAGTTATNDYNFFSCDWMLTRMAMVLNPTPSGDYIVNSGGLTPLDGTSHANSSSSILIGHARLDVAATTITALGTQFALNAPNVANWWDKPLNYRLRVGPYMLYPPGGSSSPTKISPYGLSKISPSLIRGCTHFIIEYAGSYYTKDVNGKAVDTTDGNTTHLPVPDGQIDYVIDPRTNTRQIRWYGFPRSVNPTGDGMLHPEYGDVVPLRDVFASISPSGVSPSWGAMDTTRTNVGMYADAERFSSNFPGAASGLPVTNYFSVGVMDPSIDQDPVVSNHYSYTAAWGPDVKNMPFPKMIRIIIGIEDHEGRLNQPQLYEYVYVLQP